MAEYIDIGSEVKFLDPNNMAWIEREYTTFADETRKRIRVSFKTKGGGLHRTDGPAVVIWDPKLQGETNIYYIKGVKVHPEKFKKCLAEPLERLSLYLNDPLLSEVAMARLRGETSSIKSNLHRDVLNDILHRCRVYTEKQKEVKHFLDTILWRANKALRAKISTFKPFERT